ncbi:hypothetical protein P691DRAFT_494559 [Macrolepiota fuliginosa MF-IS2]|uniref:Uncharacterized protein n=1 Tax=Macrolepiota fuliginosa MF-IS2 TaxID=1400762 RepID=A0A9P5XH83_9AGAR|nr:hypothetical protein P691DRAFT_494559 [Macrolepiota fuliginosa MF-IS2]
MPCRREVPRRATLTSDPVSHAYIYIYIYHFQSHDHPKESVLSHGSMPVQISTSYIARKAGAMGARSGFCLPGSWMGWRGLAQMRVPGRIRYQRHIIIPRLGCESKGRPEHRQTLSIFSLVQKLEGRQASPVTGVSQLIRLQSSARYLWNDQLSWGITRITRALIITIMDSMFLRDLFQGVFFTFWRRK